MHSGSVTVPACLTEDLRATSLPEHLPVESWIGNVLVPKLRALGPGSHQVSIVLPRFLAQYNGWQRPGWEDLAANGIVAKGQILSETWPMKSLLRLTQVTISA